MRSPGHALLSRQHEALEGRLADVADVSILSQFPIKEIHPIPRGLFGPGAVEIVGAEARKLGIKKACVVTSGIRGTDVVDRVVGSLHYHDIQTVVFDKVESNPKDTNVADGYRVLVENNCDGIVSVGGGSVTDCAKAIRIVHAHDGRHVREFEGFNKSTNKPRVPHIAVNTTSGTGSETSWAYVITDTTTGEEPFKFVAFDDNAVATLAVVDPTLTYSLPADYTAFCGMDVLAHAIEAYMARIGVVSSHGSALKAIELAAEALYEAAQNNLNYQAREKMSWAEYIAAQAFNSAGLGIIHAISHAVSAYYDTHHGLCNGIAMPRVISFNMTACREKMPDIAAALGIDTSGLKPLAAGERVVEQILRFSKDLGLPPSYKKIGPYTKSRLGNYRCPNGYVGPDRVIGDDADITRIAKHVMKDACVPGNPRDLTLESVKSVVAQCMEDWF